MKHWSVVIRNPGEMYCWNDQGHEVCGQDLRPEYGFEILQGIAEGPIVFGRMKDASVLYFDACMSG